MTGIVKEVHASYLMVDRDEYPIDYPPILVSIRKLDSDTAFQIGMTVIVKYDGQMTDSNPPALRHVYSVEVKE